MNSSARRHEISHRQWQDGTGDRAFPLNIHYRTGGPFGAAIFDEQGTLIALVSILWKRAAARYGMPRWLPSHWPRVALAALTLATAAKPASISSVLLNHARCALARSVVRHRPAGLRACRQMQPMQALTKAPSPPTGLRN